MKMIDIMKRAGVGAVEAGKPVAILYGTVSQTNPLAVTVDQRFMLPEDFLVVPEHLTEYKVTIYTELGSQEILIRKALEVGDMVILLRVQGGQQYILAGKVGE